MKKIFAIGLVALMCVAMHSVAFARSALLDIPTVDVIDEKNFTVEEIYESVVKAAEAEVEADKGAGSNKYYSETDNENEEADNAGVKINKVSLVSTRIK